APERTEVIAGAMRLDRFLVAIALHEYVGMRLLALVQGVEQAARLGIGGGDELRRDGLELGLGAGPDPHGGDDAMDHCCLRFWKAGPCPAVADAITAPARHLSTRPERAVRCGALRAVPRRSSHCGSPGASTWPVRPSAAGSAGCRGRAGTPRTSPRPGWVRGTAHRARASGAAAGEPPPGSRPRRRRAASRRTGPAPHWR